MMRRGLIGFEVPTPTFCNQTFNHHGNLLLLYLVSFGCFYLRDPNQGSNGLALTKIFILKKFI
jgi:hypothetical protein